MMNLIKVIGNKLESNKLKAEDRLDKILNDEKLPLDEKELEAEFLLREVALSEISLNLWTSYTTPKPNPDEGANTAEGPQPEQKPEK